MTPDGLDEGSADPPVVLVVDDDAVTRTAFARVLQRAGFATCEAADARQAMGQLTSRSVGAVVLDHQLPSTTGMELISSIRDLPSHDRTPVLFISGDDSAELRIRALRAGANDFMVKPVILAELVARVDAQLRLSAKWSATVRSLSRRSETVATLAALGSDPDPAITATVLCECISAGQDGAPVSLYEIRIDGTRRRLAAVGRQPGFVDLSSDPSSVVRLDQKVRGVPWLEHEAPDRAIGREGGWWACAPLRRGATSLGVLILGETGSARDGESVDQTLAAAVDYAAVSALHLGMGLTDARGLRRRREAMRETLVDGAFWPVFQPIVRLADGGCVGYEALTRFRDRTPPDQRLADAAEVGLGADMELALLSAAIETSAGLVGDIWLSVNVSPSVLVEHTAELVALMADAPHPLVVELTEHTPIDDYPSARAALARLGSDVRLSVDDTGAGFASLRHVVDLHPEFLKLDRSWVTGIEHDESRQALVAGLAGFAGRTGADMIAEGIETPEERVTLELLNVLYGQGYLLGRPQPLAELDQRSVRGAG